MMNKKGEILLPETLKIIVAVLCIGILILLAFKLGSIYTQNGKVEQARAVMDELIGVVNGLEEGDIREVVVLAPSGWALTGWPASSGEEISPEKRDILNPSVCERNDWKNCICLCDTKEERTNEAFKGCEEEKNVCKELDSDKYNGLVVHPLGANFNKPILVDNLISDGEKIKLEVKNKGLTISAE
jgi:hypothetical protein